MRIIQHIWIRCVGRMSKFLTLNQVVRIVTSTLWNCHAVTNFCKKKKGIPPRFKVFVTAWWVSVVWDVAVTCDVCRARRHRVSESSIRQRQAVRTMVRHYSTAYVQPITFRHHPTSCLRTSHLFGMVVLQGHDSRKWSQYGHRNIGSAGDVKHNDAQACQQNWTKRRSYTTV